MNQFQSINLKALILWVFVGGVLGWSFNSALGPDAQLNIVSNEANQDLDLDLFWEVQDEIENAFYDAPELTEEQQEYGIIRGLVESLEDPYSVFMTPDEAKQFNTSLKGNLQGIGAELMIKDGKLIVQSPLKNSPAEEAGVLPGDHIAFVDGKDTAEMTFSEAVLNIRGEEGTSVDLTIYREGVDDAVELTITRQSIDIPSVVLKFDQQDGKTIANLEVSQFAEDTVTEFQAAVREIKLKDVDGLVLDLRLNSGGFLEASVELMSEFFADAERAVIVKRRGQENEVLYTQGKGQLSEIPMVVLIDEGSASAAEIVAGALQDYKRATLVGEQSFGKGSVQELITLKDGASLRLTIAKWFTPKDRTIDKVGVTPDQLVSMETADFGGENDVQYKAAIQLLLEQL